MIEATVLTFDTDWCPEFAIEFVADVLVRNAVPATWFITHQSPAIDSLRCHPELFEIGIHPNFLPESTHGDSPGAVLSHCFRLAPGARSARTHGLAQSTPLLGEMMRAGVAVDVSLFLPGSSNLQPHAFRYYGKALLRVPYNWEDDYEMSQPRGSWSFEEWIRGRHGLRVVDFHPIHVYLNAPNIDRYEAVKRALMKPMSKVAQAAAEEYVNRSKGPRTFFEEAVSWLSRNGGARIADVENMWVATNGAP